mgnify:CR=1 FL=1
MNNIAGMRILSIDDNHNNLSIIEVFAKSLKLEIDSFLNPIEALDSLNTTHDLIIVDYMMPELNGLEFIKQVRKLDSDIPIIMLTAVGDDMVLQVKALEFGANDFLSKPLNSGSFRARISNMLKLRQSQLLLKDKALLLQNEVNAATKMLVDREHETLNILGKTAEYKDPETGAHIARVAHYSKTLACLSGQSEKFQDTIFHASPFHDIGKIGIPDKILLKPARLDADEFEIMKTHSTIGYTILKNSHSAYLKAGGIIAFNHHEKYDGTGYPSGLKGESIPILGRITAIADVFDALTSQRPYKKAWSFEDACSLLIEEKGKHFDPVLIDLFIDNVDQFKTIYDKFTEE